MSGNSKGFGEKNKDFRIFNTQGIPDLSTALNIQCTLTNIYIPYVTSLNEPMGFLCMQDLMNVS